MSPTGSKHTALLVLYRGVLVKTYIKSNFYENNEEKHLKTFTKRKEMNHRRNKGEKGRFLS